MQGSGLFRGWFIQESGLFRGLVYTGFRFIQGFGLYRIIVLLRDVFHIGLVISPRAAVLV